MRNKSGPVGVWSPTAEPQGPSSGILQQPLARQALELPVELVPALALAVLVVPVDVLAVEVVPAEVVPAEVLAVEVVPAE